MIVDFRRTQVKCLSLHSDATTVKKVKSLFGVYMYGLLTPPLNRPKFPCHPRYILQGHIECVLENSLTVWYRNYTVTDWKTLQQGVRTAENIILVSLSIVDVTYNNFCICKATSIIANHSIHPSHGLFLPLPFGKLYRSIW